MRTTREEVKNWRKHHETDKLCVAIADLALSAIPITFDPEDETTWPKKNDHYLVLFEHGQEGDVAFWETEVWSPIVINNSVKAYLPIPDIKELK